MDRNQRTQQQQQNSSSATGATANGRHSNVFENQRLVQHTQNSQHNAQYSKIGSTGSTGHQQQHKSMHHKGDQMVQSTYQQQQPNSQLYNDPQQYDGSNVMGHGIYGKDKQMKSGLPSQTNKAYQASNNFESPAGPSSAQGHHLIGNMPPSSIGVAGGKSSIGQSNVDIGGRFSINHQKQDGGIMAQPASKIPTGQNVPSSGPAHQMHTNHNNSSQISMPFNQNKGGMIQQQPQVYQSKGRQGGPYQQNQQIYGNQHYNANMGGQQIMENEYSIMGLQDDSNLESNFSQLSVNQPKVNSHERYQMPNMAARNITAQSKQPNEYSHGMSNYNNQQLQRPAAMANFGGNPESNVIVQQQIGQSQQNAANYGQVEQKQTGSTQIDNILQVMSQYSDGQLQQLFIMHQDPYKQNKLVLTEGQFNLIKQIYPAATRGNRWNLGEDQQLKQTFINLFNVYKKLKVSPQNK